MNNFKLAKQKAILIYQDRFRSLWPRYTTFGDKFHFFLFKLNNKYYEKCYLCNTMILDHWYVNYQDARFDGYGNAHVAYMLKYNEETKEIECIEKMFNFSVI
jgi:hypothetical protein